MTSVGSQVPPTTTPPTSLTAADDGALGYELIVDDVEFPLGLEAVPGEDRLLVVTKGGVVWILEDGELIGDPFLNISDIVSNGREQGLLSLAFHPDYRTNGRFFVHYTDRGGDTRVVEYRRSGDPDLADAEPVQTILERQQPAGNHNGGRILFGPDGFLYVGLGDGGRANDAFGNGQNPDTLLGGLLRLDVDGGVPYAIPADNPFGDGLGAPELWAIGLRNPWQFTFDRGLLIIADVGQNSFEEINVAPADAPGLNYGWPITEGLHCFSPQSSCAVEGITLPVVEVAHGDAGTCSIVGGVVYRGAAIPWLQGQYLYSDFCGGYLRSLSIQDGRTGEQTDWSDQVGFLRRVTAFGVDHTGEVYLLTPDRGIYKIVADP